MRIVLEKVLVRGLVLPNQEEADRILFELPDTGERFEIPTYAMKTEGIAALRDAAIKDWKAVISIKVDD